MQNGIPVGLRSSPSFGLSRSGQLTAIIQSLFWDGSQGWWYDDNDTTTLFQDSAGTTPVTAVEQFVGLQLDKSKGGVGTNGTRRVNLLTYTEQFDNAAWLTTNATVTPNTVLAPNDTLTADSVNFTDTVPPAAAVRIYQDSSTLSVNGVSYTGSVWMRADSNRSVTLTIQRAGPADTQSVTCNLTTSWQRFSITHSGVWTGSSAVRLNVNAPSQTGIIYIWGADLRLAADANVSPTYQRITDTWYNTLPGNHRYAPASGNRPIWSKRVNLLTKTEQFDDAVWFKYGSATVDANVTTAPNGQVTADRINAVGTSYSGVSVSVASVNGVLYTSSVCVKQDTSPFVALLINNGIYVVWFNFSTGNFSSPPTGPILAQDAQVLGNGWYRLSVTVAVTGSNNASVWLSPTSAASGASSGSVFAWAADTRPANQATGLLPLYQRVNTSSDYDTNGFPGYLKADGVDDFLQTNSIDFSAGPTNPPLSADRLTSTWILGAGATESPTGTFNFPSSGASMRQDGVLTSGRSYIVSFTATGSGNLNVHVGDPAAGSSDTTISSTGTYRFCLVCDGIDNDFQLRSAGTGGFVGTVTNLSVREITNANLGADKITLCAGVRKLSDALTTITELGTVVNTTNGSFWFGYNLTKTVEVGSRGTSAVFADTGSFAAPVTYTSVLSSNISGDSLILRVNGAQVASNTADQGTGNYGNYPAYFFRRGGTTLPFNGHEYGNIAVGKLLTADQTVALETYMNGLTKAY